MSAKQDEINILLERAGGSMFTAIERFYHVRDEGRAEVVLIFLKHALEMLICAAIVERDGSRAIWKQQDERTLVFNEEYMNVLLGSRAVGAIKKRGPTPKILEEHQVRSFYALHQLRNSTQHYFLSVSEKQLKMYAELGTTLFRKIYEKKFNRDLNDLLSPRAIPVLLKKSTASWRGIFREDIKRIQDELKGHPKGIPLDIKARLRALIVFNRAISVEFVNGKNHGLPPIETVGAAPLEQALRRKRKQGPQPRIPGLSDNLERFTVLEDGGIILKP